MLVLTRKSGEIIRIAGGITVTILGVQNGQVRVGIAAPADVAVDREEIHQRKIANPRAEVTHVHG